MTVDEYNTIELSLSWTSCPDSEEPMHNGLAIGYIKSELEAKGYREVDSSEASFTVLALTRIT